jgi:serine/threonine protein kinase
MNTSATAENLSVEALLAQVADEFVERLGRGERPDVEEYARRHPDLAAVLRQVLPALEVLRSPAVDPSSLGGGLTASAALAGCLGDYRVVREVGRGGMGVVYEAQQLSLSRRVALKVLPFAAALDARQLQRFKNEAQAAATLHHAHIVPVYAVGCERGVHFFAMQYIDGQSLAEAIAELRLSPSDSSPAPPAFAGCSPGSAAYFQAVARLGVQAAEALEHAHQMGVVHRDVKPANLLLEAPSPLSPLGRGVGGEGLHLWVADFGLARCRAEPGLTGTGDVVGTLRYMSPEQALAKRALVDHRSDVYSLGATLYEALTLQPAYPGQDREELLRQIADGDPRPPRRVQPAVPVALETVVLKAMAREPEGRYASAQEMADDLQRFLDGRPVLAVRPSLRERLVRWAGRHRRAVATAAGVLMLALAGLVTADVIFYQQRRQTEKALEQVRTQEAEARAQRRRAAANFEKALDGATQILMQLDPKPGAPPLKGDGLRRALIEQGLQFFRNFIDEESTDPAVRRESALAYRLMASVYCSQHKGGQGQAMLRKAFALFEGLVDAYPQEQAYRTELIRTRRLMGLMYTSFGQPLEARQEYVRTDELYRRALPYDVAGATLNNYAWFLVDCPDVTLRDPARAVDLAQQAVARAPAEGAFWNTLGVARYRAGDPAGALEALEQSLTLRQGGDPHDWFFLAMACWRQGDRRRARGWYEKAVAAIDKDAPPEDLLRYQTEAALLLGEPSPGPAKAERK